MATQSELIDIIDTLGCARTRLTALLMACNAIDKRQRDAVAWLVEDADHVIESAVDMIDGVMTREGVSNG